MFIFGQEKCSTWPICVVRLSRYASESYSRYLIQLRTYFSFPPSGASCISIRHRCLDRKHEKISGFAHFFRLAQAGPMSPRPPSTCPRRPQEDTTSRVSVLSSTEMATRGVFQLRKLTVKYCDYGGSSKGARDFIRHGIVDFAKRTPAAEVVTELRPGHHPYIQGEYETGENKTIGVKNTPPAEILEFAMMLRNSSGRKVTPD